VKLNVPGLLEHGIHCRRRNNNLFAFLSPSELRSTHPSKSSDFRSEEIQIGYQAWPGINSSLIIRKGISAALLNWIMWRRVVLVRTNISEHASIPSYCQHFFWLADSLHLDDGGYTFLRNVGSYKSHTVSHPRKRNSSQLPQRKTQIILTELE
jgi:hypothetical protein